MTGILDAALCRYQRHSTTILRVSVGLVFVGFGVMKFLPGASPAEDVATRTMDVLAFGLVPPGATRPLLALFETAIGIGLITGFLLRVVLAAFFLHMGGVFSALLILPDEMWDDQLPTLEGQYIIKNVVLIAACLAVAAEESRHTTVITPRRRHALESEPRIAPETHPPLVVPDPGPRFTTREPGPRPSREPSARL